MKRKRRSGGKYPKPKVIFTRNPAEMTAFYRETDQEAPLGKYQLAAGSIQHPDTKLWQVWLSTNGLDFKQLAAFKEAGKAANAVTIIQRQAQAGNLYDQELMEALYEFLAEESDGEAQPLPEELIRKLARDIVHSVIET